MNEDTKMENEKVVQYPSDEWRAQEWKEFEKGFPDYDAGHCAQFLYDLDEEVRRVRMFNAAGFLAAPPDTIILGWHHGFTAGHDAYNCWLVGETTSSTFPWEKP